MMITSIGILFNYNPMKNFLWILMLMVGLLSCIEKQSVAKPSNYELISKLDSLGQTFIDEGNVVGFAVAIMEGKDTMYNKGFGFRDLDQTKPITTKTRFLMASVSKLIGSTVVMKLAEEGKLSLDQSLFELLPDFPNQEQAKQVTMRHMLSHTSGLQDYAVAIDSNYVKTGVDPTKEDYYHFFKDKELLFEPGENYNYSNSGFILMAMIVERVTGNSFQEEVDRIINLPTGMNLKLIDEATNYPEMSEYWEQKDSTFIPYPHWTWIKGDGGLTATPIMLAHFPRKWVEAQIINSTSFEEMSSPFFLNDGIPTGYGLGVRNGEFLDESIIGHTGGHKSTYSIMVYFPERDLTFVCMMNTDNTSTSIRRIFAEFARSVLGKEVPNYVSEKNIDLSLYVGKYATYDHKINGLSEIVIDEGVLQYCIGASCFPMTPIGDHTFWIEKWPYDLVKFHVDSNEKSLAMKEYYSGFYAVLRKKVE